jgi:hypothetical protein
VLTDLHGEIIIGEAIDQSRTTFDYDTQDYAYQEVHDFDSAIALLPEPTERSTCPSRQGRQGLQRRRQKWLKLARNARSV